MIRSRILLLIAGGVIGLSACGGEPPPVDELQTAKEIEVSVGQVTGEMVRRTANTVGNLLPDEELTLSSKVDGAVVSVLADFGSQVVKGQLLVAIDDEEYRYGVEKAQASLTSALAALGLPPDGSEDSVRIAELPAVVQAEASLQDARNKLESARRLVETKDIPEQRYLELQKTVEQRGAALREIRDKVNSQIAAIKSQRASLALEEKKLRDTRVVAPFTGSVTQKIVSAGEVVRENSPLMTLVKTDPLRLRGAVPEPGVPFVKRGIKVTFQTEAVPGREFEAVVTDVSPSLNPASRSLLAEARVSNPDGVLRPGMFAKIEIVLEEQSPALTVPQAAIVSFGGLTKIFVVDAAGEIDERIVELGLRVGDRVEIVGDTVVEGERVATSSLNQLSSGTRVRVS